MKIGVVCDSDERFDFFRSLLAGHSLARIPPDEATDERLSALEGVLIDIPIWEKHPALVGTLRSRGFVFGTREDDCPCVLRRDEAGRLYLQCGRQAAARRRAAKGMPPEGTHTLVFQHAEPASG